MLAERMTASQVAESAAQGASVSARVRPAELPRLAQIVAARVDVPAGPLAVTVGFGVGPENYPVLRVQVGGALNLVCQRCLSPVEYSIDLDERLTVVPTEAATADLADPFDSVVTEQGELQLRVAVEDEILAALPLAPLHADVAQCSLRTGARTDVGEAQRPNRPFADLTSLMAGRRRDEDQD